MQYANEWILGVFIHLHVVLIIIIFGEITLSIKLVRSCSTMSDAFISKESMSSDECFLYVTNPGKTSEVIDVKVMTDGFYFQCKIGTNRYTILQNYIAEWLSRIDFSVRDLVLNVYSDSTLFSANDVLCVVKALLPFVPSVGSDEVIKDIRKYYLYGKKEGALHV